jgi:hypothetical protein
MIVLAILVTVMPASVRAATEQLNCSPATLRYGTVTIGGTETLLVAVTNTGQASITISSVSASNSNFTVSNLTLPQVLAAGGSLEVRVTFAPTATGSVGGQITFITNVANQTLTLSVGGLGVTSETVSANPASLSFGNVKVGSSATLPVVLTNTRPWKVTLTGLQTTGSDFLVTGANFPLTLAAGKSVSLNATFTPQVVGLTGGSSFVSGPGLNIPFAGTGSAASKPNLTITPATLSFGNVIAGTTGTLTLELSATGASVTVSSVSMSSSQFAVPAASFPMTIPAGQDASLNVTFTPRHSGETSATLSFLSNAANSPTPEGLTGTGTAPYVNLSWIASTSPEVAGYNIYRKTFPTGAYTRLNSSLDPDTSYRDATVAGGTTYYYTTAAVNSSGKESPYSNWVEVVVP